MKKIVKPEWEVVETSLSNWCNKGTKIQADNYIVREIANKIDLQSAMLYLIILSHREEAKDKCTVDIDSLAEECGIGNRTVSLKLSELESNGFLIIKSAGRKNTNLYFFPKEDFFQGVPENEKKKTYRRDTRRKQATKAPIPGIYLITNTITHAQYVGQAVDIRKRWIEHIQALRNNCHCNKSLQADFNQYGEESFEFKILEIVEDSPILDIELDRKEGYWGKKLNVLSDGYNEASFHDPFKELDNQGNI